MDHDLEESSDKQDDDIYHADQAQMSNTETIILKDLENGLKVG